MDWELIECCIIGTKFSWYRFHSVCPVFLMENQEMLLMSCNSFIKVRLLLIAMQNKIIISPFIYLLIDKPLSYISHWKCLLTAPPSGFLYILHKTGWHTWETSTQNQWSHCLFLFSKTMRWEIELVCESRGKMGWEGRQDDCCWAYWVIDGPICQIIVLASMYILITLSHLSSYPVWLNHRIVDRS